MFDNSRYRSIIKNEQRKVRATTGLCCSSSVCCNDNETDRLNNIELLSRTLIDNGNCDTVDGVNGVTDRTSGTDCANRIGDFSGLNACNSIVNGIDTPLQIQSGADRRAGNRTNSSRSGCRRRASNSAAGNTNIYRFVNQNFLNNALGRSNVQMPGLNRRELRELEAVEDILRRYRRNRGHGCRR